ncbi:MAG: 50S ribosomal protein L14e [Candidatus Aenigmatarchaeota archaeon]
MIGKGRVCMKIAGREAGRYCVVLEEPKEGFVLVTGPKSVTCVKRRRCNIMHIEPTENVLELAGDDDSSVESAWKSSGLIEKLGIQVPEKRKAKEAKERPKARMRAAKPAEKKATKEKKQ